MSRLHATDFLLDTHVLLWWQLEPTLLPAAATSVLQSPRCRLVLSAVSLWEMSIKRQKGHLEVPDRLIDGLVDSGLDLLSISPAHAAAAGALPLHHRDLFDRMLVAQAQAEGLTLVTADGWIDAYDVPVLDAKPKRSGRGKG